MWAPRPFDYLHGLSDHYIETPLPPRPVFSVAQGHAVDTYTEFAAANEERLRSLPPPLVALQYYKAGDLYYFDALQTTGDTPELRRPDCRRAAFKNLNCINHNFIVYKIVEQLFFQRN